MEGEKVWKRAEDLLLLVKKKIVSNEMVIATGEKNISHARKNWEKWLSTPWKYSSYTPAVLDHIWKN